MRVVFWMRSGRGFHWWPRCYPGIPEAQYRSVCLGKRPTDLICFLWWAWEIER